MGEYDRRKGPEGGHTPVGSISADESTAGPDVRAVRAVLEVPRRRVILEVVTEQGPVTTRDLAIQVGARVHGVAPDDVSHDQRQDLAIAVHHVDVPKLVAADVLTADQGFDRIRPGPKATLVHSLIDRMARESTDSPDGGRID